MSHNPRATYRHLEQGGVLLQLDTGQYHGLNPVGELIWNLMAGQTVGELVQALRAKLVDPPAQLEQDVDEFIEALRRRQLVVVADPP